jgi:hypothetical protein
MLWAMPRTLAIVFGLVILGTRLVAAEDASSLGQPITDPAEITKRVTGNTLSGVLMETGAPWAEFYCDTGRTLYEFNGIARGKWWTENAKICFSYEYDDYLIPKCFDMYGKADGSLALFYYNSVGEPSTFLSGPPVPGDPLHLEERAVHGCALEPSV